jgi:hypothetical protein
MHPFSSVILADIGGLLLLPIGLLALAFWLWTVVDCARHETGSSMVAWLLLILFVGIIGAPLYFFLRKLPRHHSARFHLASHLYQPWRKDQRI